jgi:hypothetical protein
MYGALINNEKDVLILHLIDRPVRLPVYVRLLQTFQCAHCKFVSQIPKKGFLPN